MLVLEMNNITKKLVFVAGLLTIIVFLTWQFTGGDFYTKYEIVEEIEQKLDETDPLVAAGFYETSTIMKTVTHNEFRLGLLPTPAGLIDKHSVAVITLVTPIWFIVLALFWYSRRKTVST